MHIKEGNIEIGIASDAETLVGLYDAIRSQGTFVLSLNDASDESGSESILILVKAQGYHFQIGTAQGRIYLKRNSELVSVPILKHELGTSREVIIGWAPDELAISTYRHKGEVDYTIGRFEVVEEPMVNSRIVAPVFPPISLLNWVRRKHLQSRNSYSTRDEFRTSVFDMISHMKEAISSSACHRGFWNIQEDSWKPKPEPQVTRLLHALLLDQAMVKGIEIIAQSGAAGGNLDFQACAMVDGYGLDRVAVEAKYAHSNDLISGLVSQLPTYMKSISADAGVYLILWCKSDYFAEPKNLTPAECLAQLSLKRNDLGIQLDLVELAPPPSPSKLSERLD